VIKLSKIKPNPNNPRFIRDHRFEKLKKSLKEFPEMMELRPIIVNRDWITLGGNMRLRALQELGHKEIPENWVRQAELSDQQQREFVVKDNLGFGDWDWDVLANEWNEVELTEWGLEFPHDDKEGQDLEQGAKDAQLILTFDSPEQRDTFLKAIEVPDGVRVKEKG
jgi:ParB-like chromosome segregation protein Spo0J